MPEPDADAVTTPIRFPTDLVAKVRANALSRRLTSAEYLGSITRKRIEADYRKHVEAAHRELGQPVA